MGAWHSSTHPAIPRLFPPTERLDHYIESTRLTRTSQAPLALASAQTPDGGHAEPWQSHERLPRAKVNTLTASRGSGRRARRQLCHPWLGHDHLHRTPRDPDLLGDRIERAPGLPESLNPHTVHHLIILLFPRWGPATLPPATEAHYARNSSPEVAIISGKEVAGIHGTDTDRTFQPHRRSSWQLAPRRTYSPIHSPGPIAPSAAGLSHRGHREARQTVASAYSHCWPPGGFRGLFTHSGSTLRPPHLIQNAEGLIGSASALPIRSH